MTSQLTAIFFLFIHRGGSFLLIAYLVPVNLSKVTIKEYKNNNNQVYLDKTRDKGKKNANLSNFF